MSFDKEYSAYRHLYIRALTLNKFPWESAYYFYYKTSDAIDVFPFEDFKQSILQKINDCRTDQEAYSEVSMPIYDELDSFFNPVTLYNKQNVPILTY